MRLCPYIDGLFAEGGELPAFDAHLPLLSLPYVFETKLDTIPAGEPYLFADPELVARWRKELGYIDAVKVGINWQGNPKYRGDRRRSIPLAHFAPLAQIEGVRLVSLQRNFGSEQLKEVRFSVTELGGQVDEAAGPFMDTAAILKNLDLLITSDTSLVHLAGGLGVPTWLAIPRAPDWRWLLERPDCPWYPSLKLFRQPEFDNWEPVFERMTEELEKFVAAQRRPPYQAWLSAGEMLDRFARLCAARRLAAEEETPFSAEREIEHAERQVAALLADADVEGWLVELDGIHEELQREIGAAGRRPGDRTRRGRRKRRRGLAVVPGGASPRRHYRRSRSPLSPSRLIRGVAFLFNQPRIQQPIDLSLEAPRDDRFGDTPRGPVR